MTELIDLLKKFHRLLDKIDYSRLILSLFIILAAMIVWRILRGAFNRFADRRSDSGRIQGVGPGISIVYDAIKWIIIVGVIITVLQINGVNVTAMVAGFGIASAIVGLAFQDMLKDVIMGIHIMTDEFFHVGDVICLDDTEGRVISYNIRTTRIQDIATGDVLTICNRNITRVTKRSDYFRITVPLAYEEDYRKVHQVLREVSAEIGKGKYVKRCEYGGTHSFEDSAILYRIDVYCPPEQKYVVRRRAIALLQEALEDAGLRIPYHQVDVHMSQG